MEKEIAAQRVLGRDGRGREVLVAALGQTIDRKRFEVGLPPAEAEETTEASAAEKPPQAAAEATAEKPSRKRSRSKS